MTADRTLTMRTQTITERVPTKFGSLYVHVSHHGGRIVEVRFSSPGKHCGSEMGEALDALGETVTAIAWGLT